LLVTTGSDSQQISAAASPESFLGGAQKYIDSACVLIEHSSAVDCIGMLAAHGVELALKAHLLHSGLSESEVKRQFGHDLVKLWVAAHDRGLDIDSDPPYWLQIVGFFHGAPYQYRYPPEGMATAIPRADLFAGLLRDLFAKTERSIAPQRG
jgi:hypothetical protein